MALPSDSTMPRCSGTYSIGSKKRYSGGRLRERHSGLGLLYQLRQRYSHLDDVETPCCGASLSLHSCDVDDVVSFGERASLPTSIRSRFECSECEREWHARYDLTNEGMSEAYISHFLGTGPRHQWLRTAEGKVVEYEFAEFELVSSLDERRQRERRRAELEEVLDG